MDNLLSSPKTKVQVTSVAPSMNQLASGGAVSKPSMGGGTAGATTGPNYNVNTSMLASRGTSPGVAGMGPGMGMQPGPGMQPGMGGMGMAQAGSGMGMNYGGGTGYGGMGMRPGFGAGFGGQQPMMGGGYGMQQQQRPF